jgi:hypothetical protein
VEALPIGKTLHDVTCEQCLPNTVEWLADRPSLFALANGMSLIPAFSVFRPLQAFCEQAGCLAGRLDEQRYWDDGFGASRGLSVTRVSVQLPWWRRLNLGEVVVAVTA